MEAPPLLRLPDLESRLLTRFPLCFAGTSADGAGGPDRVLSQLDHSAREASIETKETTQIPSFVRSYSKQQFHWLVKG
jgi:hypothetical protein